MSFPTIPRSEIDFTKFRPLRAHEEPRAGDLTPVNYRLTLYRALTETPEFFENGKKTPFRVGVMGAGWKFLRPL